MKKLLCLIFLGIIFSHSVFAGLANINTTVMDDGKVVITYDLTADDPNNTLPIFSVDFTGEINGKKPFALKTLEGAGISGIIIGEGTYVTIWNAAKDRKRDNPQNININVSGGDVTEDATYLCLDLKKNKMRYQSDPPDVKKSKCKTKELWLRRIEPGTFMMGSPTNELGRADNEAQHEVTLTKAFYIGIFEVTQKQFKTITGYNYSKYKGATRPVDQVSYVMLRGADKGSNWPFSSEVDEKCYSVIEKGKHDWGVELPTFFYSLREKTGNKFLFDLPTEAQWEYACRAETTTALNSGKNITNTGICQNVDEVGRYWGNGGSDMKGKDYRAHVAVGSYLPNAWGLYDMHGNVKEWCLDLYLNDFGNNSSTDPLGTGVGTNRVLKGGSWKNIAENCRSASRYFDCSTINRNCYGHSGYSHGDDSSGFRVAFAKNDVFAPDDKNMVRKDFLYEILSDTENTLPVFTVKFYGKVKDGPTYLLEDLVKLENDGASGIVIGTGEHTITLVYDESYKELIDKLELIVEYEEVTSEAIYLVLDLISNKMRTSAEGPDLEDEKCKTDELWLKRIESGTFTMGSPKEELGHYDYWGERMERQHEVTLTKPFYIGIFEVTQKQFGLIYGSNPSHYKGDDLPVDSVSYNMLRGENKGSGWPENNDVDEESFFGNLRKKAGNIFDLPTEAQWEFSCRAGTTTSLNNGKNITVEQGECPNLDEVGWYMRNSLDPDIDNYWKYVTHAVGLKAPNSWGLYDMHGNVHEWCLDWFLPNLETETDPLGVIMGSERVLKGGCCGDDPESCRSARRYGTAPDSTRFSGGHYQYYPGPRGFRVALVKNWTFTPEMVTQKEFDFEIKSETDNTLPVFKTMFYGKFRNGTQYPLEEIGKIEYDGASGIVVGKGKHKLNLILHDAYTNQVNELELIVEYEDVTEQATYLVLDLPSNKMRTSTVGPSLGNSNCRTDEIWLRRIEPGTFTMGAPKEEWGFDDYYKSGYETQHKVTLTKAFYIGVFETTQQQFKTIIGFNSSRYLGDARPVEFVSFDMIRGANKGSSWPKSSEIDEKSFLGELRKKAGNVFDLPTEAQWEYACRAGTTTAWNNGTTITGFYRDPELNKLGRYSANKTDGKGGYSEHTTVGSYLPNAWGLYDMHGNVFEWCLDYYDGDLGSKSKTDPKGAEGSYASIRIIRGGSWDEYYGAIKCRSASRYDHSYSYSCYDDNGFRLVIIP